MLIYSKIVWEIMWLLVNSMHTIISVTLFFFFLTMNWCALLTITSLVENYKLDMWSSQICIIICYQQVRKASIISNFKSLHSQFHIFALFGIKWHALSQSECRKYCITCIFPWEILHFWVLASCTLVMFVDGHLYIIKHKSFISCLFFLLPSYGLPWLG